MIGLVACSSQKLARPAPARELYCSPLFRASLLLAEARCDHVYVLSARHGLVELDQQLDPYDHAIGASKAERHAWAARVAPSLFKRHGREADYLILAGRDYARPLAGAMHSQGGHGEGGYRGVPHAQMHQPLARLQIGERLSWLEQELQRERTAVAQLTIARLDQAIAAASAAIASAETAADIAIDRQAAPLHGVRRRLEQAQQCLSGARDVFTWTSTREWEE